VLACEECDLDFINATRPAASTAYLLVLAASFCFNIIRVEQWKNGRESYWCPTEKCR
jgi:hypothetical protein